MVDGEGAIQKRNKMLLGLTAVTLMAAAMIAGPRVRNYLRRSQNYAEALGIQPGDERVRRALFEALQPVALSNCEFKRFGEADDGGYLMCANLLGSVQSGYSYGIAGYDKWGCDVSSQLGITVHQYDCFNTQRPLCPQGKTVFHAECVGDTTKTEDGRLFDTIQNQFSKNGDSAKRIVLKIDVEGAEWDSFLDAPDAVFEQIEQLTVEFHGVDKDEYVAVVNRLKEFFHVAHVHFNNWSCVDNMKPFPAWATEVLFVSKRLGVVDPSHKGDRLHVLDAPNNPNMADCQPGG